MYKYKQQLKELNLFALSRIVPTLSHGLFNNIRKSGITHTKDNETLKKIKSEYTKLISVMMQNNNEGSLFVTRNDYNPTLTSAKWCPRIHRINTECWFHSRKL